MMVGVYAASPALATIQYRRPRVGFRHSRAYAQFPPSGTASGSGPSRAEPEVRIHFPAAGADREPAAAGGGRGAARSASLSDCTLPPGPASPGMATPLRKMTEG